MTRIATNTNQDQQYEQYWKFLKCAVGNLSSQTNGPATGGWRDESAERVLLFGILLAVT
jgi:hypothetical protein